MRTLSVLLLLVAACGRATPSGTAPDLSGRSVRVVATTTLVADLARHVGGARVEVVSLMGAGVDPHLYQASEGDVTRLAEADLILYNGLHLEGKLSDLLAQVQDRGLPTAAVAEAVPESERLASPTYAGSYDPHVWFDVQLWMEAARETARALAARDTAHADVYTANLTRYLEELAALDAWIHTRVEAVPAAQRVLVTAHDAFSYFGAAYGFEVRGLQGLSTATEAGTADVQALADFIVARRIPALFVESSVSPRSIEAVRAAVRAQGFDVVIGGNLFSDALGSPGSEAETYVGTVRHNVDTLVDALTRPAS